MLSPLKRKIFYYLLSYIFQSSLHILHILTIHSGPLCWQLFMSCISGHFSSEILCLLWLESHIVWQPSICFLTVGSHYISFSRFALTSYKDCVQWFSFVKCNFEMRKMSFTKNVLTKMSCTFLKLRTVLSPPNFENTLRTLSASLLFEAQRLALKFGHENVLLLLLGISIKGDRPRHFLC